LEGYRETEIGHLPQEWEIVRIGDLFQIQQGKALSKKSRMGRSPRPFLRVANVLWGRVDLTTLDMMDFTDKEAEKLSLSSGDLLVCEGGVNIGRTAMWRGEVEGCLYQNHVHRLRTPRLDVEPAFYRYWMEAGLRLFGFYGGAGNNTAIPNLSKTTLSSFSVPLPPLSEQRAITHVLRTVERAIETTEQIMEAARELKRSLMNPLFTYGPVSVDEAEYVPLKDTEVGQVPEHWKVIRIGDIATVRRGASPRPKGDPRYFSQAGPVHWIKISDLREHRKGKYLEGTNEFLTEEGKKKSYFVPTGTLLLTNSGTVGIPTILHIDGCIHDGYLALLNPQSEAEFLYYFLEHSRQRLEQLAPKGTQANLNTTIVKTFQIALPPLSEQRQIIDALSAIGRKLEVEENRKKTLEILFKTLLHNLMTGKIRVRDITLEEAVEAL